MTETTGRTQSEDALVLHAASRNRRIHTVATALLAAAVVVVSAVALRPDGEHLAGPPVRISPERSRGPMNADEQLAHDFATTWFSYDRALAASYLATGAASAPEWRQSRLDEALGNAFRVDGCYQIGSPSPTTARVGCLYTIDLLGLGDVGRGPFRGNLFLVAVQDGEVVDFFTALGANDYDEVGWGPFVTWVEDERGRDVPDVDDLDDTEVTARAATRAIRFWQRMGQEYVAAVRSGEVT